MSRPKTIKQREAKRRQHKRYYARSAFRYEARPWSSEEDELVLAHKVPDSELSANLHRSMKAICNRRWRLRRKKEN